jgi:hypothetical protein
LIYAARRIHIVATVFVLIFASIGKALSLNLLHLSLTKRIVAWRDPLLRYFQILSCISIAAIIIQTLWPRVSIVVASFLWPVPISSNGKRLVPAIVDLVLFILWTVAPIGYPIFILGHYWIGGEIITAFIFSMISWYVLAKTRLFL